MVKRELLRICFLAFDMITGLDIMQETSFIGRFTSILTYGVRDKIDRILDLGIQRFSHIVIYHGSKI